MTISQFLSKTEDVALHKGVTTVITAFSIAGSLAPFPGGSAIPDLLLRIQRALKDVKCRKQECEDLSRLAARYVETYEKQEKEIANAGLEPARDQVLKVLQDVDASVTQWASYGKWRSIWNATEVSSGIQNCKSRIQEELDFFDRETNIKTISNVKDIKTVCEILHTIVETRDLPEVRNRISERIASCRGVQDPEKRKASYAELDSAFETLVAGGKRSDDDLRLCSAPISRAAYNALVLQVEETLKELHAQRSSYPVPDLGNKVVLIDADSWGGGMYTQLYKGRLVLEEKTVALKTVRNSEDTAEKAAIRFNNEIKIWVQLKHKNVHTIYGYTTKCTQNIALVSEYHQKGNLFGFTKNAWNSAHKLKLLEDAAAGMQYLHEHKCIHGNLKSRNILVTDQLDAVISDFQMSKIVLGDQQHAPQTFTRQASPRWSAPELSEVNATPTFEADVWAFGMVMVEVFTGKVPFANISRDTGVQTYVCVHQGKPERPQDEWVTDEVWQLMQDCWKTNPRERPTFEEIHKRLTQAKEVYDKTVGYELGARGRGPLPELEPLDL